MTNFENLLLRVFVFAIYPNPKNRNYEKLRVIKKNQNICIKNCEFLDFGMGQMRKLWVEKSRNWLTSFSEVCISEFEDFGTG